jgi:hypothetical protein
VRSASSGGAGAKQLWPDLCSSSTGNQLYQQPRHRQPVILVAPGHTIAQATSYLWLKTGFRCAGHTMQPLL